MNHPSEADVLETLAAEFAGRLRRGERPSLDEYAQQYPELASQIREAFPVMAMMEELAPSATAEINVPQGVALGAEQMPYQLADYRIIREIGRGGMGVVYEAEQVNLGRSVALKVLPGRLGQDAKAVERFRREATAAGQLHHENIVPIYDVGNDDDIVFYTMQLIRGKGLDEIIAELKYIEDPASNRIRPPSISSVAARSLRDQVLDEGTVPYVSSDEPTRADTSRPKSQSTSDSGGSHSTAKPGTGQYYRNMASLGLRVADALAHAHSQGVVHRDIKPSNLMIDPLMKIWVTDFGLAKVAESDLTEEHDVLGTIRYMAPEQSRGWADPRSDVYSLGVTLYELVSLSPAFTAKDRRQLMKDIETAEPPSLQSFNRAIPRDLQTIIFKAIDKEPAKRYQTCDGLRDDLQRFLDYRPIRARRATPFDRVRQWVMRNKPLAGAATCLIVTLFAWAVSASRAARESREQVDELYPLAMSDVTDGLYTGAAMPAIRDAFDIVTKPTYANRQHWETEYVRAALGEREIVLASPSTALKRVVYSPDGKWFAAAEYFNTIRVWDAKSLDQKIFKLDEELKDGSWLAASPDGQHLACRTEHGRIHLIDVTGRRPIKTVQPKIASFSRPAFSWPDGKDLIVYGHDGEEIEFVTYNVEKLHSGKSVSPTVATLPGKCQYVNIERGRILRSPTKNEPKQIRILDARSPGDEQIIASETPTGYLFTSQRKGRIVVADVDTSGGWPGGPPNAFVGADVRTGGKTDWKLTFDEPLRYLKLSPDGRILAGAAGMEIHVYYLDTRQSQRLRGHVNSVRGVAFSPDSTQLVSGAYDSTVRVWDLQLQPDVFRGPAVGRASLSDDGRLLVISNNRSIQIWDAITFELLRVLNGHAFGRIGVHLDLSPDGKSLVTASTDIRVWDVASGNLRYHASPPWGRCDKIRFHPKKDEVIGVFGNGKCAALSLATSKWRELSDDKGYNLFELAVSPDGRWVSPGGTTMTPKLVPLDSYGLATKQFEKTLSITELKFSPDSQLLAIGGKDRHITLQTIDGDQPRRLRSHRTYVTGMAFSSDGKRLFSTGHDGMLKIFDPHAGQLIASLDSFGAMRGVVVPKTESPKKSPVYTFGDVVRVWEPVHVSNAIYRQRLVNMQAHHVAQRYLQQCRFQSDASTLIKNDPKIPADVRDAAIQYVHRHGDAIDDMYQAAYLVALNIPADEWPGHRPDIVTAERYALAAYAGTATPLPEFRCVMGILQYRNGKLKQAYESLTEAAKAFQKEPVADRDSFGYRERRQQIEFRILAELYLAMVEKHLGVGEPADRMASAERYRQLVGPADGTVLEATDPVLKEAQRIVLGNEKEETD